MASRRIRIGVPIDLDTPPAEVPTIARYMETAGFDSIWIGEPPGFNHGSVTLTMAAQATTTLPLAYSLTNPYTRHASVNAMLAATLDDLSHQRLTQVFGAGSLEFLRNLGLDWVEPVQHLRELIQVCRALWRGESVSFPGKTINMKGFQLRYPPQRAEIPIFIGCRRPHMSQLAGELADGIILDNAPVGYLPFVKKQVETGAQRSGRILSPSTFTLGTACAWAVDSDREKAREKIRDELPMWLVTVTEKEILDAGFSIAEFEPFFHEIFSGSPNAHQAAAECITPAMIDAFSIAGTPEDCVEKIHQYEKQGVDLLLLTLPSNPDKNPWQTASCFREDILPHFQS